MWRCTLPQCMWQSKTTLWSWFFMWVLGTELRSLRWSRSCGAQTQKHQPVVQLVSMTDHTPVGVQDSLGTLLADTCTQVHTL